MNKLYSFRSSILALILIYFGTFVLGQEETSLEDNYELIRQKRHILCYFGFNDVLKDILLDSLEDLREDDPVLLGNSIDDKLEDGVLQGLSSLTNITELVVDCDEDGLVFSTVLGIKNAVIHYKWRRKYLIDFDGTIWSRAEEVHFDVEVKLNLTSRARFDITRLEVTKLEGFKFGFSGLGPLNTLVKGFVKIMHTVWSTRVTAIIQNLLKEALENKLRKLSIPF